MRYSDCTLKNARIRRQPDYKSLILGTIKAILVCLLGYVGIFLALSL